MEDVLDIITSTTLLFRTDRLANQNIGAFSWTLSIHTDKQILTNSSESWGKDQYSFHAEVYVILSVYLVNKHISILWKIEFLGSINVYADSTSFITKYIKHFAIIKQSSNVKSYVSLEWDVFQELLTSDSTIKFELELHHVHSHQDKATTYEQVPFTVQLNIQVDKLAEEQQLRANGKPFSALYASTKAYLILDNRTIT